MAASHCPSCCSSFGDAIGGVAQCQILSIRTCPDGSLFEHGCSCGDVHVLFHGSCSRMATIFMVEKVLNCLTIGTVCDLFLHGHCHHVRSRLSCRYTSDVGCFLLVTRNFRHFRIYHVLHSELYHDSNFKTIGDR